MAPQGSTPGQRRRHKAYVVTTDEHWLAFKAICIVRDVPIEHALGRILERVVESPAPMEPRRVIGEVPGQTETGAGAAAKPPAKRKANVRSTNKRSSRPTRKSGS